MVTFVAMYVYVVTNMSKIQSESNSQLSHCDCNANASCDQYVKDTIWKQFTTNLSDMMQATQLWPICQRYNLKAIHNTPSLMNRQSLVVTNMSKIQSESNSQPGVLGIHQVPGLWPICQRYNLKAIHNKITSEYYLNELWPICQRYNLKAIHNSLKMWQRLANVVTNMSKIQSESNSQHINESLITFKVVTNMSKIQSESNSQLNNLAVFRRYCCDQYVKDTIWKQFTTSAPIG